MRQNSHIGNPFPTIQAIRPVFNNPSYSYNVFAKRMLKTGNAVELAGFFNANLNPVVANVVINLGLRMTERFNNSGSVNRIKSPTSGEKPSPPRLLLQNQLRDSSVRLYQRHRQQLISVQPLKN